MSEERGPCVKQIILLHTVQTMYLQFEKKVRESLAEEVKIDNILDTYFSSNPNEVGYFSTENMNRLYFTLKSAELAKPVCIPIVCSSLSPYIERMQPFISVPLLQIDKRLAPEAIAKGNRIMVLSSAPSSIKATVSQLEAAAQEADKSVTIDSIYDIRAFHAMMGGDMETHERVILEAVGKVRGYDVIVFAQGSLEYLTEKVENITGIPTISAPKLLVEDIRSVVVEGG